MSALAKDEPELPDDTTTLSSENKITLPAAAMQAAHVEPGDYLRVEVVADGVIRLVREDDPWIVAYYDLAGSAPGIAAAANLEELRNEWER